MFPCILLSLAVLCTASLSQVTTGDYCEFLNAAAVADPDGYYDEKMENITRTGVPGFYYYNATTTDEEKPAIHLTALAAMRYCNWKQAGYRSEEQITDFTYTLQEDQLLAINPEVPFFIASSEEEMMCDFLLAGNTLLHEITQILPLPPQHSTGTIENASSLMYQATSRTSEHPVTIMGNLVEFFCTYGGMLAGLMLLAYLGPLLFPEAAIIVTLILIIISGILGLIAGRALGRAIGSWIG